MTDSFLRQIRNGNYVQFSGTCTKSENDNIQYEY